MVTVYDAATGIAEWHLTADTRSIPKPVVYGVVPVGVKAGRAAEALQPGIDYGVYVAVLVGTDTLASIGSFTAGMTGSSFAAPGTLLARQD